MYKNRIMKPIKIAKIKGESRDETVIEGLKMIKVYYIDILKYLNGLSLLN
jgi:hypothetical protein